MTILLQGANVEGAARASGLNSHAEGYGTQAIGQRSHAEGSNAVASGFFCHAENNTTTASGNSGHAEGDSTVASGNVSHAEGFSSIASGNYSSASGYGGKADALAALARGGASGPTIGASRCQTAVYSMGATVAAGGASVLTFDGGASIVTTGAGVNVLLVPLLATYTFELNLSMRAATGATRSQGWLYAGMIVRDASSTARLVGSVTQLATWADTAIGSVSFSANTTSNYLNISCGSSLQTASTIWHGVLTVNELVSST